MVVLWERPISLFHLFKENIGTITSDYYTAVEGTTITLSNTPDMDYNLVYYTVNGTPIQGNTFVLTTDVIVSAVFNANYVEVNGKKWMMTDLAYDDGMGGIYKKDNLYTSANGIQQPYLGTKYYYSWSAAKRVADKIDGWHLPTSSEWLDLIYYASGTSVPQHPIWPLTTMDEATTNKLKSSSSWKGTNDLGLNFLPLSMYDYIVEHTSSGWCVTQAGKDTCWYWCSDGTINEQCCITMSSRNGGQCFYWNIGAMNECPVRLIKDS